MKFLLSFLCLLNTSLIAMAQTEYKMSGPYEVVARDGKYRASKGGTSEVKLPWGTQRTQR